MIEEEFKKIFKQKFKGGKRAFSSTIGVQDNVLEFIYKEYLEEAGFSRENLLWACHYCRKNETLDTLRSFWGVGNIALLPRKINGAISCVADKCKIDFGKRLNKNDIQKEEDLQRVSLWIDTFPCCLNKFKDRVIRDVTKSYKGDMHCVKYLIGVGVKDGCPYYLSKRFVGRNHDSRILQESGLLNALLRGERVAGDKAFKANKFKPQVVSSYDIGGEYEILWKEKCFNYARQIVERSIGRISKFRVVKKVPFRGNFFKMHDKIIRFICYIVYVDMQLNKTEKNRFVDMIEDKASFKDYLKKERPSVIKRFEDALKGEDEEEEYSHLSETSDYNEIFETRVRELENVRREKKVRRNEEFRDTNGSFLGNRRSRSPASSN